ncbi:MAG: GNAT family N-acetyltransferase [Sedimenticola sp.]
MKIRYATLKDIPAILFLGEAMMEESRFRDYGLNREKCAKMLETMISTPSRSVILIAEHTHGNIVGMLAGYVVDFFFCDAVVAQDRFFFVKPEARGSSAAIKLLMAFRRWAEQRNVSELNINMSVAVEMSRFNKMMSKLGFRCCGSNFSLGLGGQSSDFLPTSIAREVT